MWDKYTMEHIQPQKKGWNSVICSRMDGRKGYQWNKPGMQGQHVLSHMWKLKASTWKYNSDARDLEVYVWGQQGKMRLDFINASYLYGWKHQSKSPQYALSTWMENGEEPETRREKDFLQPTSDLSVASKPCAKDCDDTFILWCVCKHTQGSRPFQTVGNISKGHSG